MGRVLVVARGVREVATLLIAAIVLVPFGVEAAATPAFKPADGRYTGEYTSGNHGAGKLRLHVGLLRPGLHGVRLLKWSGKLRCPGHRTRRVGVKMSAARIGRTFSGYVTYRTSSGGKDSFTGRFTARNALKGRVRVRRGSGAERCDTGPITFVAHRVGP
jgi:hypothetical protein